MQIQSSNKFGETPPTLLERPAEAENPIVPLFEAVRHMDRSMDVLLILQKAADRAGFVFLFEVPASLFGDCGGRAAVIECPNANDDSDFYFVISDQDHSNVSVLDIDEIPELARNFFASYVSVLASLRDMPAVKNLH